MLQCVHIVCLVNVSGHTCVCVLEEHIWDRVTSAFSPGDLFCGALSMSDFNYFPIRLWHLTALKSIWNFHSSKKQIPLPWPHLLFLPLGLMDPNRWPSLFLSTVPAFAAWTAFLVVLCLKVGERFVHPTFSVLGTKQSLSVMSGLACRVNGT